MYSLKELFKIGNGPSSSHTIGPLEASKEFLKRYGNQIDKVNVVLYGSLALTGRGHLTDYIIEKTLLPTPCHIEFDLDTIEEHPNTMIFYGYRQNEIICEMKVISIGGGAIRIAGEPENSLKRIYPLTTFKEISAYCKEHKISLPTYVDQIEKDLNPYLENIYSTMLDAIDRGLVQSGVLPGKLQVKRKASYIYRQNSKDEGIDLLRKKVFAYAYAVSEENASGGLIVTAPTCGASGVLPACLKYALELKKYSHQQCIDGLKVAGLIGNIVKTNGSISGAEAGCQAEVGTACAMSAAFLAYLDGGSLDTIERASEIALEHHLGLTCDPVLGYVQIPCIERNAVAALRAIDAAKLASYLNSNDSKISFDSVVKTMLNTGHDLRTDYRETAEGGLAKLFEE
ncbi:MAG: L-serine ammonia-lyase, iron-sulfur-dependent, subunit alpha [Anaeroplasmataceae bacterium]|nr:L-serine ammonia-lyase, iron-sulfur-dependent, subunit alpha [Anaeroplasmataceae bacterium]